MTGEEIDKIIGSLVALAAVVGTFWYNWRATSLRERKIYETVEEALIKKRIEPYTSFLNELRFSSSQNCASDFDDYSLKLLKQSLHSAIYGQVGMLASHVTRQLLVYTRLQCDEYKKNRDEINFKMLRDSRWAVLVAIRSDLGIEQPAWKSVLQSMERRKIIRKIFSWIKPKQESDIKQLVANFSRCIGEPGMYIWPI